MSRERNDDVEMISSAKLAAVSGGLLWRDARVILFAPIKYRKELVELAEKVYKGEVVK